MPEIRERWNSVHGRYPNQDDVDAMFKEFIPAQMACLNKYTGLIPGTAKVVQSLKRDFGLKIGNTTGFQRVMVFLRCYLFFLFFFYLFFFLFFLLN